MKELLTSASKLVFIMITFTACITFATSRLDAKDFMMLASMAFAFYFSQKGESEKPYGGK